ncbi:hypothetical protein WR25_19643 isoform A [Diploscapter pachys]|uniref:Uncharacterized protein n=1 Tax=Diploscapter pachys TaxID=2018661 RepID=A0A2A2LTV0_9BILA|nr:hypothetical protein WR25_19643 isoform A [Diploscapter pachys]
MKHYLLPKSTFSNFSTPKPEDKREHLRDTRPGICRPLILGHGPEAVIEQAAEGLTTSSYPPVIVATSCLDETDEHQQIVEDEEVEDPEFEVVTEPRKRRQLPSIEHLKGSSLEEERESLLKSAEHEDIYRQRRENLVKMHRTSITEWTMPVVVGGVQQQQRRIPIGGETLQYLAVHPLPRQALSFDERINRRDQRRNSEYTDVNVWSRMGYSQDPSMRDVRGDDAYDQYHQRAQIQTSLQLQNRLSKS